MARKRKITIPEEIVFQPVKTTFKVAGGARRKPSEGLLEETGLVEFNKEATEGLDRISDLFQMGRSYSVYFTASPEHQIVEVKIATDAAIPGQMAIRRSADGRISMHIGGVFEEHPGMRPDSRRACPVVVQEENRRLLLMIKTAAHARKKTGKTRTGTRSATATRARASRKRQNATPTAENEAAQ